MMLQEAFTLSGIITRTIEQDSCINRNKKLSGQIALSGVIVSILTKDITIRGKLE